MTERAEEIPAYPLYWPDGWKRTRSYAQNRARYSVTFAVARDDLIHELSLLGAKRVVISSNVQVRHDGFPLARVNLDGLDDPGVAVYFEIRREVHTGLGHGKVDTSQVIACDKWDRVKDNLRACGMAVASLRQLQRCGASEILERAFTGFKALAAGPSCWSVLGIEPTSDLDAIDTAFKRKALEHHPDRPGGDTAAFQQLQGAYQMAKERVRSGSQLA